MYIRHRKKKNREYAGPIEYLLISVLIIVLTIGLMIQFEPQVSYLVSFVREYLLKSL